MLLPAWGAGRPVHVPLAGGRHHLSQPLSPAATVGGGAHGGLAGRPLPRTRGGPGPWNTTIPGPTASGQKLYALECPLQPGEGLRWKKELPHCSPRKQAPRGWQQDRGRGSATAWFPPTSQSSHPFPHPIKGRGHTPHTGSPEALRLSRLMRGAPNFSPLMLLPQIALPLLGPGHPEKNPFFFPHPACCQPEAAWSKAAELGV